MKKLFAVALFAFTLSACALTKPGGIDTPEGQMDLADIVDITQLACNRVAIEWPDEMLKVETGLALVRQGLLENTDVTKVDASLRVLGLKDEWRSTLATVFSIASRRVKRYVDSGGDAIRIADAIVNGCRTGITLAAS